MYINILSFELTGDIFINLLVIFLLKETTYHFYFILDLKKTDRVYTLNQFR